jgi:hypothetical protein
MQVNIATSFLFLVKKELKRFQKVTWYQVTLLIYIKYVKQATVYTSHVIY